MDEEEGGGLPSVYRVQLLGVTMRGGDRLVDESLRHVGPKDVEQGAVPAEEGTRCNEEGSACPYCPVRRRPQD